MTAFISVLAALGLLQIPPTPPLRETPISDVVRFSVSSDRETYYVGERILLRVSAENVSDQPLDCEFDFDPRFAAMRIDWRYGESDFTRLRAFPRLRGVYGRRPRRLEPGQTMTREIPVAVVDLEREPLQLLFEKPGPYEFRVFYTDDRKDRNADLESNVLRVEVVDAPAEEQAAAAAYSPLLAYVAQIEDGYDAYLSTERRLAAVAFLERFPESRYSGPVREGLMKTLRTRIVLGWATADERADYERLTPSGDTVPPMLLVEASPATLWPPNHRLVTVKAMVVASDTVDENPQVKLESITCDDGCDIVHDVHGAELDTDDREFELRAERRGHGSGRRYTITYSATDASGNTATTSTTVLVPHDQGKGKGGK